MTSKLTWKKLMNIVKLNPWKYTFTLKDINSKIYHSKVMILIGLRKKLILIHSDNKKKDILNYKYNK